MDKHQLFSELRALMMDESFQTKAEKREKTILLARGRQALRKLTPEYDFYFQKKNEQAPGIFLDVVVGDDEWGYDELVVTNEDSVITYNVKLLGDDEWHSTTNPAELPISRIHLKMHTWEVFKFWLIGPKEKEGMTDDQLVNYDLETKDKWDVNSDTWPGTLFYVYDTSKPDNRAYFYVTHTDFDHTYNEKHCHFSEVCAAIHLNKEADAPFEANDYHVGYGAKYNTHPCD